MDSGQAHEEKQNDSAEGASAAGFPVVGIGASAGGLKAIGDFLSALPGRPEMAFVVVQHLDPNHDSALADLLRDQTEMTVEQIEDHTTVQPGRVYVIPPGKRLTMSGKKLLLSDPQRPHGQRAPIDEFFRSLAEEQGEHSACVVLSGTGSDGSVGLKSIKECGGAVLVQEPEDADHDGMPKNALATGMVDVSAPAGELARQLIQYHDSAQRIQLPDASDDVPGGEDADLLQKILAQVRMQTSHDFSTYKAATVLRRVKKRMQVCQIAETSDYLAHLRDNEEEARALMKEFLISVTNFFRDRETFEVLEREIIPKLFRDKGRNDTVRVWVAGCATGEEPYSLAMLLCEARGRSSSSPDIQIFASDIDEEALQYARAGLYPDVIGADVRPDRLERFFKQEAGGYRVRKSLQELVLFAQHNLLKDPPFSKLDLVSCRNLLIYLDRDVQHDVFRVFHYALRDEGHLLLGGSETAEVVRELFAPVDKKHRIYSRKPGQARLVLPLRQDGSESPIQARETRRKKNSTLGEVHRELMLDAYAPPSVLVNEESEICYLFGDVGAFLRPVEGEPKYDILQMAPRELRVELRPALFQVFKKGQAQVKRRVRTSSKDGKDRMVDLGVRQVARDDLGERLALVIFDEVELPELQDDGARSEASYDEEVVRQLEDELDRAKHRLDTAIEEYETSNEELKASNEELQSMNEELRSTTEELETSKEELQSTNEELQTVNAELKAKVEQLNRANSDLENLMASTHIGTLFLDSELTISRYTPAATELFNILPADIGRPFQHVSHKIDHEDLTGIARRVLNDLNPVEEEIRGREGGWFLMRVLPYRTLEDRIDGVVLTLVDITERKKAQEEERNRARQQEIVADLRQRALSGGDFDALVDLAVRQIVQTLDVEFCKVLELQPENDALLLCGGYGWKEGRVGIATESSTPDTPAGFTLSSGGPVVVRSFDRERRFEAPQLLEEHDVVSGLSVVLQGAANPFGVLGAYSTRERTFLEGEVQFVQSVANVLGTAIERRRADDALRESERKFRTLFEDSNDAILLADLDTGYFVDANQQAEALTGYSHDELLSMRIGALTIDEEKEKVSREVNELKESGSAHTQRDILRKDGERRTVDISSRIISLGGERVVQGVMRDVTERSRMQKAIQEREATLNTVLDALPAGVVIADAKGRITRDNAATRELWGVPPETDSWEGYRDWVGWWPETGERIKAEEWAMSRALHHGEETHNELVQNQRFGSEEKRYYLNNVAPIRDADGNVVGGVAAMLDVTDRLAAEHELRELNQTLEQRVAERTADLEDRNRELQNFAHIASHDLREPLRKIQSFGGMLQEEATARLNEQENDYLDRMQSAASRMDQLLRDLLAFSRVRTQAQPFAPVDLGKVVEDVLVDYELMIRQTKAKVELNVDAAVQGDTAQLRQLVTNLVGNAFKYRHPERPLHLRIGTSLVAPDEAHLRRADGEVCRMEVEDNGIGFPQEYASQIFDPFNRLHGRDAYEGTGMGLAICRRIVDRHGGLITAEGKPGEGARFVIELPSRQA